MARVDWIETRLQNWARWHLARGGEGPLGYSSVDLGVAPTPGGGRAWGESMPVPTNAVEAAETDAAIGLLYPAGLRLTVLEVYVGRGGIKDKALRLCCSEATVHKRIDQAHQQLAEHFLALNQKRKRERQRVEAMGAAGGSGGGGFYSVE